MKKVYNVDSIPSVKSISDIINNPIERALPPRIKTEIINVLEGVERLDGEVKQKDQLLSQKDQLLLQKEQLLIQKDKNLGTLKETGTVGEQKEFVDALHKLYPKWYPKKLEDWSPDTWGKQVIDKGDYKTIQANLPAYRQQVLEKEFIDILHELYPSWYPMKFEDWPSDSWGKGVVDRKDYKVMEANLPTYKQWLANKKEFIEIIPKLYSDYPVGFENWTNQWGKGLLDKGDYKTIENSLPAYRKQLARKEFIEILPKLYPNDYPVGFENWTGQWGKGVVDREDYKTIQSSLAIYKRDLLKKEFIDIMHQVNPKEYPAKFEAWSNKTLGKTIVEKEDYEAMKESLSVHRQKLKEMEKEKLLSQKENELKKLAGKDQLLNDREQEIAKIKELLSIKELEAQNKEQLLLAKELEKQELARQKEELLAQKEKEIHNKSLVKNQVVKETEKLLTEQDIRLQNLLELNGKLDAKMDYARKEIEIREVEKNILSKMLIQKHEILKNLLVQKESEVNEKSFEKNLLINQLREEIEGLNKQIWEHNQHITHSILLDDVGCQPGESLLEKQILESLNLSSINLSPINHGGQNQNLLGNFDINNVHTTHSVLISGEESSFDIIQEENFH